MLNWVIGWLRKCVEVLIEYLLELLAGDINNNGDTVHKLMLCGKAAFLHLSHKSKITGVGV